MSDAWFSMSSVALKRFQARPAVAAGGWRSRRGRDRGARRGWQPEMPSHLAAVGCAATPGPRPEPGPRARRSCWSIAEGRTEQGVPFHASWAYNTHTEPQFQYLIQVALGLLRWEAAVPPLLTVTVYGWTRSDRGQRCRVPTASPIAGIVHLPRVGVGSPIHNHPGTLNSVQHTAKDHRRTSIINCWATPTQDLFFTNQKKEDSRRKGTEMILLQSADAFVAV